MMTPQGAALMAEYNRWMNERLYDAAETLGETELAADKGAFFGSILGTLNQIAVADSIWLGRFARHLAASPARIETSGIAQPASLREPLAADLAALRPYRRALDALVVRWVGTLTDELLSSTVSYSSLAGAPAKRQLGALLQHFFNHQTHHRGQVTTLLSQAGVDMGATDLVLLIPSADG